MLVRLAVLGAALALAGCGGDGSAFDCGSQQCRLGAEYCRRVTSDVVGQSDGYVCLPLPQACGTAASCDCVKGVSCSDRCAAVGNEVTVTCPGG
jgi:hypothetical protein